MRLGTLILFTIFSHTFSQSLFYINKQRRKNTEHFIFILSIYDYLGLGERGTQVYSELGAY